MLQENDKKTASLHLAQPYQATLYQAIFCFLTGLVVAVASSRFKCYGGAFQQYFYTVLLDAPPTPRCHPLPPLLAVACSFSSDDWCGRCRVLSGKYLNPEHPVPNARLNRFEGFMGRYRNEECVEACTQYAQIADMVRGAC